MANGPPNGSPAPAWLQPVISLVTNLGFPVVVAGFLLWIVFGHVTTALDKIQSQEDLRTQFVAQMQKDLIGALDRQTDIFKMTLEQQTKAFDTAIDRNIAAIDRQTDRLQRRGGE